MAGINYKIGTISSKFHYPYEGIFGTGSGPSYIIKEATGNGYINLTNAVRNHLIELKAYGGAEQSNLPKGYTEYEYLRSDGTQYIDLGYKGNGNTKVEVKFKHYTTTTASGSGRVFGSRDAAAVDAFAIGSASGTASTSSTVSFFFGNQPYLVTEKSLILDEWLNITFDKTTHNINGVDYGEPYNDETFETPQNLKLFGFDNSGTLGISYVDIAYCKLWDNGVLIRDLIPCKNSSNVFGMYDLVTGDFLTNDGTGDFSAGNTAVPTPTAPMNIVCNNGVLKVSPNLANYISSNVTLGYWLQNSNGAPQSSPANFYTAMFRIKPDTSYVFYGRSKTDNSLSRRNRVAWYDENGTWIRNFTEYVDRTISVDTSPSNAAYARFHCNPVGSTDVTQEIVDDYNWIFQEGTAEVTYMPYGQVYVDGTVETIEDELGNTATTQMLLKIGDYVDEQEILSGDIIRKIGIKVLDGTGNRALATATNLVQFYTTGTQGIIANDVSLVSSIAPYGCTIANRTEYQFGCFSGSNGNLCFQMQGSSVLRTVDAFKQFLTDQYNAGTPVIVVYPLATPTTETVAGQTMDIQEGNNTIEITQASIDNLGLYAKYKATA